MPTDPKLLEKEAHTLLLQEKFDQAYGLFRKAAETYKLNNNHKESALCFASAASCWALRSGEKTFSNSATAYKQAALEAEVSGDLEYASLLYRYAAISFERDMEFINFSECFYLSRECYRKFLTLSIINPQKIYRIAPGKERQGIKGLYKRIFMWFTLSFSALIWGHGERPARAFFSGVFLIFISSIFYTQGRLLREGVVFKPSFFQALYFSVVTFTTVGFGDITPIGFNKLMVIIEAFCGLFIISIFIIGLSRKYLRV